MLREGTDIALIATGYPVHQALDAARLLQDRGYSARVIDMHTIKPLDKDLILDSVQKCGCLLTVEEHSISGGLRSAVCEAVCEGIPVPVARMGICEFSQSGAYEQLLEHSRLDAASIAARAEQVIRHNTNS